MICPYVRPLAPYSFLLNVVFFIVLTTHFPLLIITQTSIQTEWIWQFTSKILSWFFFFFQRNIRLSWTFLPDNDVQWISQVKGTLPHLFWLSRLASRLRRKTIEQHEPRKKPLYERKAPATKGNWRCMVRLSIWSRCVKSRYQMAAKWARIIRDYRMICSYLWWGKDSRKPPEDRQTMDTLLYLVADILIYTTE